MEKKINIANILKHCPKGMKLDCTIYDNVEFEGISDNKDWPIAISVEGYPEVLNPYGCISYRDYTKCVIYPKGKTTWEGFVPPCKFKDGDIIYIKDKYNQEWYSILSNYVDNKLYTYIDFYINYSILYYNKPNILCEHKYTIEYRLAAKEEKEKLFKVIKDNGYQWNPETKTLDELFPYKIGTKVWTKSDKEHKYIHTIVGISSNSFGNLEYEIKEEKTGTVVHYPKDLLIPAAEEKPKFKVGDKIRLKENHNYIYTITGIRKEENKYECGGTFVLRFSEQDNWELVPNKFDITTLKPFESRVLVRDNDYDEWKGAFWSHLRQKADIKYDTIHGAYRQCIPYNDDTKHLLGKTNDCDEYFKNWK